MPPLVIVDCEAFGLHGPAEEVAMPTLQGSAAGIIGKRARGHFVVGAGHLDGFAGFQIVQSEIDGAAAIVSGTLRGIGDEYLTLVGRSVPENLGHVPGAVSVVDEQAVAEVFEMKKRAHESFGCGALKKGAGLRVDRGAEEVVGRRVAGIEVNGGVERCKVDEVGGKE